MLRKLLVIAIATFASSSGENHSRQLHFGLGVLIVLLWLQEAQQPFNGAGMEVAAIKRKTESLSRRDRVRILMEKTRAARNSSRTRTPSVRSRVTSEQLHGISAVQADKFDASVQWGKDEEAAIVAQLVTMHRVEVMSLVVLVLMVWCAVFFGLSESTNAGAYANKDVLSALLLAANAVFMCVALYHIVLMFCQRQKVSEKLARARKFFAAASRARTLATAVRKGRSSPDMFTPPIAQRRTPMRGTSSDDREELPALAFVVEEPRDMSADGGIRKLSRMEGLAGHGERKIRETLNPARALEMANLNRLRRVKM